MNLDRELLEQKAREICPPENYYELLDIISELSHYDLITFIKINTKELN